MRLVNITANDAEDALVTLAGHLPVHITIGRPLLAQQVGRAVGEEHDRVVLITAGGVWSVSVDDVEQQLADDDARPAILVWHRGDLIDVIAGAA